MTEYEAAVRVINEHIMQLSCDFYWLKGKLRDIRNDPDKGIGCPEYQAVMKELVQVRAQRAALWDLTDGLEERVRELLQADAMGLL